MGENDCEDVVIKVVVRIRVENGYVMLNGGKVNFNF